MTRSLVDVRFPHVELPSTEGGKVKLSAFTGRFVVFFYPYTGKPGHPDPEGWDQIPGAHGSTPQALAFSATYDEFAKLGVKVFGVSFQSVGWQREFIDRNEARVTLLSDEQRLLSTELQLETFKAGTQEFLVRRTVIVCDGVITCDFHPVPVPAANAGDVLKVLQA